MRWRRGCCRRLRYTPVPRRELFFPAREAFRELARGFHALRHALHNLGLPAVVPVRIIRVDVVVVVISGGVRDEPFTDSRRVSSGSGGLSVTLSWCGGGSLRKRGPGDARPRNPTPFVRPVCPRSGGNDSVAASPRHGRRGPRGSSLFRPANAVRGNCTTHLRSQRTTHRALHGDPLPTRDHANTEVLTEIAPAESARSLSNRWNGVSLHERA